MAGLYIHIPFCTRKCIYCDFLSGTNLNQKERYLKALSLEMSLYHDFFENNTLDTIYIGGGTPSLLTVEETGILISTLKNVFDCSNVMEMTIECNPDDMTDSWLCGIRQLGFNRLSIGIQSFNDNELKWMNRRHSAAQAEMALKKARLSGFDNISVDVIFGLPNQSIGSLSDTLNKIICLDVQHISAYSLMVEHGSKLDRLIALNKETLPSEELGAEMFTLVSETLKSAGFSRYEISNYALEGYESKHNRGYWNGIEYLGLGASACSFDGEKRWENIPHTIRYCNAIENGEDVRNIEILSENERFNESVFTGLRTSLGIDLDFITRRFGNEKRDYIEMQAKKFINENLMTKNNNRLSLTEQGVYISDSIMSDFMLV